MSFDVYLSGWVWMKKEEGEKFGMNKVDGKQTWEQKFSCHSLSGRE